MSDLASPPELLESQHPGQAPKRKASAAGLAAHGARPAKAVKRRASKACQCCRARKVRCNVVEHGAPCTNCRLDEIECVVSESKRKKKWTKSEETHTEANPPIFTSRRSIEPQNPLDALQSLSASHRPVSSGALSGEQHVPHSIYQSLANSTNYMQSPSRRLSTASNIVPTTFPTFSQNSLSFDGQPLFLSHISTPELTPIALPYYLKPIPSRIGPDELVYLKKKGALSVPDTNLRNELLRSYIEYCHPFMPLIDLHDFLKIVNAIDGGAGKVSLFTFSAIMFVGTAYVDFSHLQKAGYNTRKEARKDFFQKTRLLYDFDYEIDRISLVQGLLLMTYWYETPDDQKDTWHYMGLAISLAHTIGLHRNPERSNMDPQRKRLWRRIWWSLYMRDRLVALGMRRPTRIKSEDYDVPMMTIDDFEIAALPDYVTCVPTGCILARDIEMQRQLAIMCIEKTKLCLCISQVLSTQYSVLNNNQGILSDEGNTRTTMMLIPKKLDSQTNEIQMCDKELQKWSQDLPEEVKYRHTSIEEVNDANSPIIVNRAMLRLVFFCALSALHRPQVLPSIPPRNTETELLEASRRNVRWAANEITDIAQNLYDLDLIKYLPTTGVTVLLPAIIIHLLDIKAPNEETRRSSLRGFCQCMQVMSKLRDNYAAADYSTAFLEAAIRKAEIVIPDNFNGTVNPSRVQNPETKRKRADEAARKGGPTRHTAVNNLVAAGHNMNLVDSPIPPARTLTPPPEMHNSVDHGGSMLADHVPLSDADVAARLNSFLASTPPGSSSSDNHTDSSLNDASTQSYAVDPTLDPALMNDPASTLTNLANTSLFASTDFEQDFDSLLNVDLMLGQGQGSSGQVGLAMQGESSGFTFDMDFVNGMSAGAGGVGDGDTGYGEEKSLRTAEDPMTEVAEVKGVTNVEAIVKDVVDGFDEKDDLTLSQTKAEKRSVEAGAEESQIGPTTAAAEHIISASA